MTKSGQVLLLLQLDVVKSNMEGLGLQIIYGVRRWKQYDIHIYAYLSANRWVCVVATHYFH